MNEPGPTPTAIRSTSSQPPAASAHDSISRSSSAEWRGRPSLVGIVRGLAQDLVAAHGGDRDHRGRRVESDDRLHRPLNSVRSMNSNSSIPAVARRARTIAVALAIAGLSAGFVACDDTDEAVDDAQEQIDSAQEEAEQQIDQAQEEGAGIGDEAEQKVDEAQQEIDEAQEDASK